MTINRIITAALLMAVAALTAFAAPDYAALRREADASQAAVSSPSAACNRGGGETFAEFLVKFTVDAAFNAERTRVSSMFALSPIADYRALVNASGHQAGYTQMWTDVGADCVKLTCGYAGAPADYIYVFKRTGGKWYLTDRVTPDF